MKNHLGFLLLLLLLFTESFLGGQNNVQIFQDQASTEPSAILNVASENKGILIPRMTSSQRAAISNPADGLMVFQTDGIEGFYYCIDNSWEKVQDESESVPIGTVIEWWRPDSSFPVPGGYAICDGALITDVESPLNGTFLPDLIDNFVKGVTDVNAIGDDHASMALNRRVEVYVGVPCGSNPYTRLQKDLIHLKQRSKPL